jgi:transposase-like protein
MAETRRKFDQDFKEGAVRLVQETGKPIAQVAKDLGVNEGTLGNWVNASRSRYSGSATAAPPTPSASRSTHPPATATKTLSCSPDCPSGVRKKHSTPPAQSTLQHSDTDPRARPSPVKDN